MRERDPNLVNEARFQTEADREYWRQIRALKMEFKLNAERDTHKRQVQTWNDRVRKQRYYFPPAPKPVSVSKTELSFMEWLLLAGVAALCVALALGILQNLGYIRLKFNPRQTTTQASPWRDIPRQQARE